MTPADCIQIYIYQITGQPLLTKLSAGDLIAQEAKCHAPCLASLYNKVRDTKAQESKVDNVNHGIAFAGLVSYIEEVCMDNLVVPVFRLTDLMNMYSTRLVQLGMYVMGCVHSTKFVMWPSCAMRMLVLHWGKHVSTMLTMMQFNVSCPLEQEDHV